MFSPFNIRNLKWNINQMSIHLHADPLSHPSTLFLPHNMFLLDNLHLYFQDIFLDYFSQHIFYHSIHKLSRFGSMVHEGLCQKYNNSVLKKIIFLCFILFHQFLFFFPIKEDFSAAFFYFCRKEPWNCSNFKIEWLCI